MTSCWLGYGREEVGGSKIPLPKTEEFDREEDSLGRVGAAPWQECDTWTMSFLPLQFDGPAREELQQVAAQFCSYQSIALELIKTKQRKESRFQLFMQVSWAVS